MKTLKRWIIFFVTILFVLSLMGCGGKNKETEEIREEKIPNYSSVVLLESKEDGTHVLNLNEKEQQEIQNKEDLLNILYNNKAATYVYSLNVQGENSFNHNKILIEKNNKKVELKDFYSAIDLKLNLEGNFLAFRSFKSESIDSAEGLKIYDINKNKYVDMKSKVLVSGNLYHWLDKDKIAYYGGVEGEKGSNKIYLFDTKENKEKVYIDKIKGICTYFVPVKNNLLFLSMEDSKVRLNYYDVDSNSQKVISSNIDKVTNAAVDYSGENVFFIGSEEGADPAVYQFSVKTLEIKRINYDFPKYIDLEAGISVDEKGHVYFCGTIDSQEEKESEVYMYDVTSKYINLISNHTGKYSISTGQGRD